ncbi:ABC transporter permease [uncultured Ruthenibacterium sp.]|uniref:ABC transporter permease n=1 Tax=uncultured Ruthenibacterium sp. TaxID=1905347 RepID=UPI00349EA44F
MINKWIHNKLLTKFLATVLSFFIFGLLWAAVVHFTSVGKVMPGPIDTLASFFAHFTEKYGQYVLPVHVLASLRRVMIGYFAAAVAAIALGILMATYKTVDAIVSPLFNLIRPIPPVAWIPLAILWFGINDGSKYFLSFLASFLSILQNVYAGAKSADPTLIGAARMLGANDRHIFLTVVLPNAVPYVFSGLQLGLNAAWAMAIGSEMIRSTNGVGWIIIRGMDNNDLLQELVGILAIGFVGFVLASSLRGVEAKLCRWTARGN